MALKQGGSYVEEESKDVLKGNSIGGFGEKRYILRCWLTMRPRRSQMNVRSKKTVIVSLEILNHCPSMKLK